MISARFTKMLSTNKCSCRDLRLERSAIIVVILVAFCLVSSLVPLVKAGKSMPVINTTSGPVRGEILRTVVKSLEYSSFRSIRYAEAPTGYQRFKPPVTVKPWTDVFNATVEGNACPQFDLIFRNYTGSEDCLFINVFTPLTTFEKKNEKGKAVMVWIYGGSFISGYARTTMYGADFLIEDDVILVTLNYRVGPLGFLSLNHTNATGNAGMKDQVLALKWVNQNIENFGGDTTRITIFGNSAGSVAVDLHTLSESSKDLFHGVIAISGSPFNEWAFHTPDQAVNKSFALGLELDISTDNKEVLLQGLYEATPQQLAMATNRMGEVDPPFRPTVEDPNVAGDHAFLIKSPLDKYKSGNFTKVPYITGFTAQETAYLYTAEDANEKAPNMTLQEFIELTTFKFFAAGIDIKQRFLVAQSSNPVYYYRVSFNPAVALHELLYHVVANGSAHADDLAYMFHMPLVDLPLDETDPISITRRRVVRMWTNFAKYRNPTPDGEADPIIKLTWPASGSSGIHLDIGDELSIKPDRLMLWTNILNSLEARTRTERPRNLKFICINGVLNFLILANELTTVVNTTSGPVQGQILSTAVKSMKYAYFAGIRYANPPVGYLRFKPPVAVDPWTETLNATVEGDMCPQLNIVTDEVDGSEDCLFLNVATPVTNFHETPQNLTAVIVWIHGGAFTTGTSSAKKYSPDYLLERDVVFVSISYRLGAFGFLTLNHANATGNAGLKDQNLALKWIQANIDKFGGNPDNVTLLGQSSGAASIGFHTLSDASVGLFHGTISMSGTALMNWAFRTPKRSLIAATKLGILMGTNSNDKEILLKTFYTATTEKLVRAVSIISKTTPLIPTLEDPDLGSDVFLSMCSISKYMSGNFSKVPQILGFVQKESLLYLTSPVTVNQTIAAALEDYPSLVLSEITHPLGDLEKLSEQRNRILFETAVNETSDILFKSPIDLTQSILAANNDDKPVYYYHFTFYPNISLHDQAMDRKYHGATHNDDLSYVFWYPSITDNLGSYGHMAQTAYRVSTMWTNFAKYGNPTPHWIKGCSVSVTWPNSGRSGRALEIGNELTVTERPISLNTEIIKAAITENIGLRSGCAVTTIGYSC